ncbi:MAG: hypothetical protein HFI86_06810 [Bacilli bacterium]|nr:hypothetical protein [Bacilli bacterium]
MKLYRVLENSFLSKGRLDEKNPTGLEGLYYTMGIHPLGEKEVCLLTIIFIKQLMKQENIFFYSLKMP